MSFTHIHKYGFDSGLEWGLEIWKTLWDAKYGSSNRLHRMKNWAARIEGNGKGAWCSEKHFVMAIFGKNGFIRKREVAFARRLLVWKYEKSGAPLPDETALSATAEKIVGEAHLIAKRSGTNVLEILKDLVKDVKKEK